MTHQTLSPSLSLPLTHSQSLGKDNQSNDWIRAFVVSHLATTITSATNSARDESIISASTRLLDTFRHLHPSQEKAYTCWSTFLDTRKTNFGTRIDYILVSLELAETVSKAEVWQHLEGSDHCPVFAELDVELSPSCTKSLPALCSCFYTSKQSKLSAFLSSSRPPSSAAAAEKVSRKGGGGGGGASKKRQATEAGLATAAPTKLKKSLGQKSLLSFAAKTATPTTPSEAAQNSTTAAKCGGSTGLSEAWKGVFRAGAKKQLPPPLCSGHNEACVLRKVKKQSLNKDRQFWVCARPVGSKDDPQASCGFFQWAKK